jgi:hypothetical protein
MWEKGKSGNPLGRPRTGNSAAELARQQIDKHLLFEKLPRQKNSWVSSGSGSLPSE